MKTYIIVMLLSLFLLSCASDNEKKALDEVAKIYNATTSYSKNFRSSAGHKTIKEFNINVSNSSLLDTLPKGPAASNIAIVTYNNWNDDEKKDYTAINVALISEKKDTTKFKYDVSVLREVAPKAKVFNEFSKDIIAKKYKALDKYKDNKFIPQSLTDFMQKNIATREKTYGALVDFKPTLILEGKKKNIIQPVGVLIFKNGKRVRFYTIFDKAKGKNKIQGIHFI